MKRDSCMITGVEERAPKLTKLAKSTPTPIQIDEQSPAGFYDNMGMPMFSDDLPCLCGDDESAKVCANSGFCKCFEFDLIPDESMDNFLQREMGEDIKAKTATSGQDKEKLSKFLLTVPQRFIPAETTAPTPPVRSQTSRSCHRYTFTEEKALVHAKLRLQIEGFVGMENGFKLTDYYEYYLQKLAPTDYRRYPARDASALTRKFKAINHNSPKLVPYIDRNVESRFWDELVQLVAHKPLLHPIFYKEKPNARTQE